MDEAEDRRAALSGGRLTDRIGMGVLTRLIGESYEEVMRLLVNGLRFLGTWRKEWTIPTTGAITQARQRLGAEPLQVLFERVAVPCARQGTRGAWLGTRRADGHRRLRAGGSRHRRQ